MKRLISALAKVSVLSAALLAAHVASAQKANDPQHRATVIEQLARDLNLTDAQKARVKQLFDDERLKRDAERAQFKQSGGQSTPELRHAKMQELEQDLTKQMSNVLTPEQLQKFKQIEQEHRHHGRPDKGPPSPAQ
jgi:Spy/CpxP family protein refolding chaperone